MNWVDSSPEVNRFCENVRSGFCCEYLLDERKCDREERVASLEINSLLGICYSWEAKNRGCSYWAYRDDIFENKRLRQNEPSQSDDALSYMNLWSNVSTAGDCGREWPVRLKEILRGTRTELGCGALTSCRTERLVCHKARRNCIPNLRWLPLELWFSVEPAILHNLVGCLQHNTGQPYRMVRHRTCLRKTLMTILWLKLSSVMDYSEYRCLANWSWMEKSLVTLETWSKWCDQSQSRYTS